MPNMGSGNTRKTKDKKGIFEHGFDFTKRPVEEAKYRSNSKEREGVPAV
jgi:hypothetical protein